jgi:putative transposase
VTYYVLFFIHLDSSRVDIAGITIDPGELWMKQIARNVTMERCGVLRDCRYLLHDRDKKYTQSFRTIIASGRVEPLALPARSPNLNGVAERLVGSIRRECLDHIIVLGEAHLRRILRSYACYYNGIRTHRSLNKNAPSSRPVQRTGVINSRAILGGLHHHYARV